MAETISKRRKGMTAALSLLGLAGAIAPGVATQAQVRSMDLKAGMHLIHAEVAATDDQRMRGLMYRRALEADHGMVFVFDQPTRECMWMRNTLIPLAVAFIDADGRVVNIEEMEPQTDASHCAYRKVPFALEMAAGWFREHGVVPGSIIGGLPIKR